MRKPCSLVAAWVLVAPLLSDPVVAQPRTPPESARPEVVPTPETGVWMQRVPGRYFFDGVIHHVEIADYDARDDYPDGDVRGTAQYLNEWTQPVVGRGDCIAFAEAPGLQCIINLLWPEMWNIQTGRASLGAVSDLSPAMLVAGVNPDDQAIRFLMVDKRGLAHPGALVLNSETASAKVDCVDLPGVLRCNQKLSIEAREASELIFVTLSTEVRYQRSKLDRKPFLDRIGDVSEKPREWLDELLTVTFSMRRDEKTSPGARTLSVAPMSAPEGK